MGHGLLQDISLCIIAAVVLAYLARLARQPLILGYIAGGVLLGKTLGFGWVVDKHNIELISEIGLILLLFIIGLEINLRDIAKMGKKMAILGISQFALNAALAVGVFLALAAAGIFVLKGFDLVYLAVCLSLSSTLIVVKLLQDKFEMRILTGQLTLGILIFQDIWAILFMGLQPNLSDPSVLGILKSIGAVFLLVGISFVFSRYVLGRLFKFAMGAPELVVLTATAWCFALSGGGSLLGLSKEMGALVAGVSIAAFPYGADVISKLSGVRDFFVTLFFVSLGMQIPKPTMDTFSMAMILVGFVSVSRLLTIAPVVRYLGFGWRPGFITALNLSQASEFSLVILALGSSAPLNHISQELAGTVLTAMIITSVVSPYVINYNDSVARFFMKLINKLRFSDAAETDEKVEEANPCDIVVLGNFRIAQAFLNTIELEAPDWKKRIMVVDYNTAAGKDIADRGFHYHYGDLAHPESLEHCGIGNASYILTTISDTFLKGTSTARLLSVLKTLAPKARFIMTGEDKNDDRVLREGGAYHVLLPGQITGSVLYEYLVSDATSETDNIDS